MFVYHSNSLNPFFNIAAEEFFFKKKTSDFFLLYRNNDAVIIGKHQNAFAEANLQEIHKNNIPVIRRLSGGGTVYHDHGNINFTFIVNKKGKHIVDFKEHMQPIFELLLDMGIDVKFSKRNDLFIDKNKISGNAEHVVRNRVLHHGTLLFNSKLNSLKNMLHVDNNLYKSKAIKSVKSPVGNIIDHINTNTSIEEFCKKVIAKITEIYQTEPYELTKEDNNIIQNLIKEKYQTWQWNYAYSPDFSFTKTYNSNAGYISNDINIKKGIIHDIKLASDYITSEKLVRLESLVNGKNYHYELLGELFTTIKDDFQFELINIFF